MPDEQPAKAAKAPDETQARPERPQPAAQAAPEPDEDPGIPTGFPVPVPAPGDEPRDEQPDAERVPPGHKRLHTVWPLTTLHLPPLKEGGETVTITREGTVVDEATADRAHTNARLTGHALRES